MWKDLISYILNSEGYGSPTKKVIPKAKYFLVSNPFTTDVNPSSCIYYASCKLRLFNSDIDGKQTLEPWEWTKLLGYYSIYVEYLAQYYEMSVDELLENKALHKRYHVEPCDQVDVEFSVNKISAMEIKSHTEIEEVQLSSFEKKKAIEYIESLNLKVEDGLRPCRLRIYSDKFEWFKTAICYDYENCDYKKYRYLTDEKKYRFRAKGRYEKLYVAQRGFSSKCYVVESEKDAIITSKYTYHSVFGLSGTSVAPDEVLAEFDEIEVLLDVDKFYERCWSVYKDIRKLNPNAIIVLRPKILLWFNGKTVEDQDFGDLHSIGRLDEDIITTGRFSRYKVHKPEKLDFLI